MSPIERVREFIIRRSLRRAAYQLERATERELTEAVPDRLLDVFVHAAKTVPAYAEILAGHGVSAGEVSSIEEFRRNVPILDKQRWFSHDYRRISVPGTRNRVAAYFSSSGHTGFFSIGTETRAEQYKAAMFLEFALQQAFGALDKRTLLINCLSMGVRAHTRTIPIADTSVREDIVLALLRKTSTEFEQFLLLGEHLFLKSVVDEGMEGAEPIRWRDFCIHAITGAEFVAENYRSYLASRLGIDLECQNGGSININYGLSEITASIAHENWHTIQIRRLAYSDAKLRRALCGDNRTVCPAIMQYHPSQVYLETALVVPDRPELLVTVLSKERAIPIIRYNTGDHARLLSFSEMAGILTKSGRMDLLPPVKLPFLLLWGKYRGFLNGQSIIYPEQVKEAIFANFETAAAVTGRFRIIGSGTVPRVLMQLKSGHEASEAISRALMEELNKYVNAPLEVDVVEYHKFPYGMRNDLERKCQYF